MQKSMGTRLRISLRRIRWALWEMNLWTTDDRFLPLPTRWVISTTELDEDNRYTIVAEPLFQRGKRFCHFSLRQLEQAFLPDKLTQIPSFATVRGRGCLILSRKLGDAVVSDVAPVIQDWIGRLVTANLSLSDSSITFEVKVAVAKRS